MDSNTRPLTKLEKLAVEMAITTPLSHAAWVHTAYVSWKIIDDVRKACEAEGINWRQLHKSAGELKRKAQAKIARR